MCQHGGIAGHKFHEPILLIAFNDSFWALQEAVWADRALITIGVVGQAVLKVQAQCILDAGRGHVLGTITFLINVVSFLSFSQTSVVLTQKVFKVSRLVQCDVIEDIKANIYIFCALMYKFEMGEY